MASRILLHSKPFDLIEKSKPLYRNVRLQAIHNNGQKGSISALQRAIWNHQQQEQSSMTIYSDRSIHVNDNCRYAFASFEHSIVNVK